MAENLNFEEGELFQGPNVPIYVIRKKDDTAEPSIGFTYDEDDAEEYCEDCVVEDYEFSKVPGLNQEFDYDTTIEKLVLIYKESGYGNFSHVAYTPDIDEAREWISQHDEEGVNYFTEEIFALDIAERNMTAMAEEMLLEELENDDDVE